MVKEWNSLMKQIAKSQIRKSPRGYNTMANGGQIMRFKLDSNKILLYN